MSSLYTIEYDLRTSRLDVPEFPFYWILVASFAVLCLVMIALIVKRIRMVAKR
jgi:hypothetical protein